MGPGLPVGAPTAYAELGPHKLENGILLRKDLHALFDVGYVTVTPSLELRVSRRLPLPPAPPSAEYLEWHGDSVFRG